MQRVETGLKNHCALKGYEHTALMFYDDLLVVEICSVACYIRS